jgi:hypothetical protein
MKRLLLAAAMAVLAGSAPAADVGVSISVGEPGFYGRIDIGDFPRPQVIYQQPVIIHHPPGPMVVEPIYLRVPPGYAKHWSRHCHEYDACGKPVYFVRDKWYNDVYAPRYRERGGYRDEHRDERGERRGHGHGGDGPPGHDRRDRD